MELFAGTGNWMEALGKTLIHSIWIALLVLSLLRFLLHSIPDRNSGLRYRLAVASLFVMLTSVFALFFLLFSPGHSPELVYGSEKKLVLLPSLLNSPDQVPPSADTGLIFILCTYIYLAGIPIILTRSALSVRYLRRMKKYAFPVQKMWFTRFEQLKESLGIRRKVSLLETTKLTSPALIGFLKPVVLVPAGMLSNLSVSQVETILLHELHHLRRLDTVVNVMQLIIENLFFYNPAVRAISSVIRSEREKCCDDRVLASCSDPISYAKALYQLAGQDQPCTHLAPGASGTDQFQLFTRIKRILNQHAMKNTIRERLFSLLLLTGGLLIMLTVSGFSSGFSIIKDSEVWHKTQAIERSVAEPIPESDPILSEPEPIENPDLVSEPDTLSESEPVPEADPFEEAVILHWPDTLPEIDWEAIKKEMEEARIEVMEEIDWDAIKKEMEEARIEVMEEIDWDAIKKEMEEARIDLDSLKMDMDFDFDMDFDLDMDSIRVEVNRALEGIDWEELGAELAQVKIHLDSVLMDLDLDVDVDVDK